MAAAIWPAPDFVPPQGTMPATLEYVNGLSNEICKQAGARSYWVL
jgi:hypothetical protein